MPKDHDILYLNDSKKLTANKREELYDVIMEKAIAVGIGMASPQRIDEINILQATYEAMREAISKLKVTPQLLLNDAVTIPGSNDPAGSNHQGRCQKRVHCSGQHRCKGNKGQDDGRV